MYCIKCGVKLAETEQKCPLCNTVVYHPELERTAARPLYPSDNLPKNSSGSKVLNGAVIILFLIPLLVCLAADLLLDGKVEWFGYVAGALVVTYVAFALPRWFAKPMDVVFVPCSFAAVGAYLFYINFAVEGNWFWRFALPVVGGIGVMTCTIVILFHYLRRGKLYILGGAFVALGLFMLLIEFLLGIAFSLSFIGWSIYPLVVLGLFGCLLIYLAINGAAREMIERKLFF